MLTAPELFGDLGHSLATDYFFLREQLTKDRFAVLNRVRRFVDEEVSPVINGYSERAELPWPLIHRLAQRGHLTDTIAGLAKLNNTRKARVIAADARDMLGGNGILLENQVIRHMADIEAIHTYEGTETMQTLIVGRDITGVGAFA